MTSEATVKASFIEPLLMAFDPPQKAMLEMLCRKLCRFSEGQLERGRDRVIESRRARSFPSIADCLEACDGADKFGPSSPPVVHDDGPQREALANRLVCCEMGIEAAQDGWIGWMWDFCKREGRAPSLIEGRQLKAETIARDRMLRELLNMKFEEPKPVKGFDTLGAGLGPVTTMKVIKGIQGRRKRLSAMVMAWADGGAMQEAAE